MKIIGLYGTGGFAREIMPLLQNNISEKNNFEAIFVTNKVSEHGTKIDKYRILHEDFFYKSNQ